jgi:hypothetical protein
VGGVVVRRALLVVLLVAAPSSASASNGCVDHSDIVGERVCRRYGDSWSTERLYRLVLSGGFWSGHTSPASRKWAGSFGKDDPIKFGILGRSLGVSTIDDVGFDFRLHGYASRNVYLGFDWALAFGAVKTNLSHQEPNVELSQASGVNFFHAKLGGVVGAAIPLGPLTARIESVIGVELASVSANARYVGRSTWIRGGFTSVNLLLEPRLAVDVWTSPWSTITAWGGVNMIYPSERSMGLSFALHARAFDGRPR